MQFRVFSFAVACTVALAAPVWAQGGDKGAIDNNWIQTQLIALDALFGDVVALLETFLFADLHAHLMAIPFTLLSLGMALNLALRFKDGLGLASRVLLILALALALAMAISSPATLPSSRLQPAR